MTCNNENDNKHERKGFHQGIYVVFFWCMIGVSVIYGIRLWYDVPVNPTFLPIIGVIVAAVLSFTLVISFEYHIGPIEIKLGPNTGFSGASGPIILWCICFLVIVYGFYLLGMGDAATKELKPQDYKPCAIHTLLFKGGACPNKAN